MKRQSNKHSKAIIGITMNTTISNCIVNEKLSSHTAWEFNWQRINCTWRNMKRVMVIVSSRFNSDNMVMNDDEVGKTDWTMAGRCTRGEIDIGTPERVTYSKQSSTEWHICLVRNASHNRDVDTISGGRNNKSRS